MKAFDRIILGSLIGGFANAIGWYFGIVLFVFVSTSKFDLAGEWGGNLAVAFIGGIVGAITDAVTGIFQPKQSFALISAGVVALICFLLVANSFLSGGVAQELLEKRGYWQLVLELSGFAGAFVISVLVVWIVARTIPQISKDFY
jgi:hypothetical protein